MKESTKRWILIGSFAVVLTALAVLFPLLLHPGETKLSAAEPRVTPTPAPRETEEDAVAVLTPAPTPARIVETPAPVYPRGAVNLLVDGVPLFALDNHDIAAQLVTQYLNECAYEGLDDASVLLTAAIDATLSTLPADGTAEFLSVEDAMNRLRRDRTLIPVRRTVERVVLGTAEADIVIERTPTLPSGARMFRRYGVPRRTLVLTETLFRAGTVVSETETLNMTVLAGVPKTILNGSYRKSFPPSSGTEPVLYPDEGVKGPVSASLSFISPIRGRIVGCYGVATGTMRYGVDYAAAPGTRIVAPESGTVVFLGERPGLGFVIEIAHDEGFVSRLSLSADTTESLALGMHVEKGDTLATLPPRENAPEAFLHYELLIDGIPYNPLFYLPKQ